MKTRANNLKRTGSAVFSKAAIFIALMTMVPLNLIGQSLKMVSSNPAQMETNVPLNTTVSFTFSEQVKYNSVFMYETYMVFPEEAITINSYSFSQDSTTISFNVTHEADTEYHWFFMNTTSPQGNYLQNFGIVRYTTANQFGDKSFAGSVNFVNNPFFFDDYDDDDYDYDDAMLNSLKMADKSINLTETWDSNAFNPFHSSAGSRIASQISEKLQQKIQNDVQSGNGISYHYTAVILLDNPEYFTGDGENDEDAPDGVAYVTIAEGVSGDYEFVDVQPGTYYAGAFMFEPKADRGYMDVVAYGYYGDTDSSPLPVDVTSENAADIDFNIYGFKPELLERMDAADGISIAKTYINEVSSGSKFLAVFGFHMSETDFDYRAISTEDYTAQKEALMELAEFGLNSETELPDGKSYFWEYIFFHNDTQRVDLIIVMDNSIVLSDYFDFSEIPDEDKPPAEQILQLPALPDNVVGSVAAVQIAKQNGLQQELEMITPWSWYYLDYELTQFWFEYPEMFDAEDDPFWVIEFHTGIYDFNTNVYTEIRNKYFINAITGVFIDVIREEEVFGPETFYLISSSPSHGSINVPKYAEIQFVFSDMVEYGLFDENNFGERFMVSPADDIKINYAEYSGDTVTVHVEHLADGMFHWVLVNPQSVSGAIVNQSYSMSYTTLSEMPLSEVSGTIHYLNNYPPYDFYPDESFAAKLKSMNRSMSDYDLAFHFSEEMLFTHGIVVLHTEFPEEFMFNNTLRYPDAVHYTVTDSATGNFTFDFVPNGSYYVTVHLYDGRFSYPWQFGKGLLIDEHLEPIAITVNDSDVSGLEITAYGFQEDLAIYLSGREIKAKSDEIIHAFAPDSRLVYLTASEYGNPSMLHDDIRPFPSGKAPVWFMVYSDINNEMLDFMEMIDEFVIFHERVSFDELSDDMKPPVSLDSIKTLPDDFIDSHVALQVAWNNGLETLVGQMHPFALVDLDYSISSFYFEYPELFTYDSNPFWEIVMFSHYWSDLTGEMEFSEGLWLIDAITGKMVDSESDVSAENAMSLPAQVMLHQNYPNPFNPVTTISYELPAAQHASLIVYDITGRRVAVLAEGLHLSGTHTLNFDGRLLASGMYLYQLKTEHQTITKKITLIK